MKRFIGILIMALAVGPFLVAHRQESPPSAESLIKRVTTASRPIGLRAHATLTRSRPGAPGTTRQLEITRLHEAGRKVTRYRQVWPEVAGGLALVIDDAGAHELQGFWYRAGVVTALTRRMTREPFFDTDGTLEDAAELFWSWPGPKMTGREPVREYDCMVLEFRPRLPSTSAYSLVKAWVSPELSVALRIDLFGAGGQLAKRIGLYRVLKLSDRFVPGIITIEPEGGPTRTVLEATKQEMDARVSAADFTVAAVRRAVGQSANRVASR